MRKNKLMTVLVAVMLAVLVLASGCSPSANDPTPSADDETVWEIKSGYSELTVEVAENRLWLNSLSDEKGNNVIDRTRLVLPEIAILHIPSGYDIQANEEIPEGTKLKDEYKGLKWVYVKTETFAIVDKNNAPAGSGKNVIFEDKDMRLTCTVTIKANEDSSFDISSEITNGNNFDVSCRMDNVLTLDIPYTDGKTDISTSTLIESLDYSEGDVPVYFRRNTYRHEYSLTSSSVEGVKLTTEDIASELTAPFFFAKVGDAGIYIAYFGHDSINIEALANTSGTELITNDNTEGGEYGADMLIEENGKASTPSITFGAAGSEEKALELMKNSAQGRINMEHASTTALVVNDNFNGTELDDTLWTHCEEFDRQGGSRWRDEHAFVDGTGRLVIEAVWDDEAGLIETGAIFTNSKRMFTKGYYEASIRMPLTKDVQCSEWGAFWLLGPDVMTPGSTSKTGTEIDIIESFWPIWDSCHHGTVPNYVDGDVVEEMYGETVYGDPNSNAEVYDGEYHTFALEWNDDMYYFYVDNVLKWETNKGEICEVPLYMIFSIEAGPTPEEVFKSFIPDETSMYVDYVRIFEKNPYIER